MSVQLFPNGIFATPNIGATRLADIFNSDRVYLVDGDNGTANATGTSPLDAYSKPSYAIDAANAAGKLGASVYIRPRMTTASAQTYYTDNIVVPPALPGLSLIGAGSNPYQPYMGVDIKVSTASKIVVEVKAAGCTIDGLRLAGTTQTAGYAILQAVGDTANGTSAAGLAVYNCRFDNAKDAAIKLDSVTTVNVIGCSFHNDVFGIQSTQSFASYAVWGLKIQDCDFGGLVASRGCDILLSQGGAGNAVTGSTQNVIDNCRFHDGLPANTTGSHARYIKIINADMGMITNCHFSVDASSNNIATFGTAGSKCIIPATWFMTNSYASNETNSISPIIA